MKITDWLRPGIRLKRWIGLGLVGVASISYGLSYIFGKIYMSRIEVILSILLIITGCIFIFFSIRYITNTFFLAIKSSGFKMSLDSERLTNLLLEKRILIKGPKIVAMGGGTGLSTMLRGLKSYSTNLTAVVTVADDGGGSGVLREDLGILPPGDIRNCVLALANTEPILEKLLQYRFKDGMLKGQSFGNLFLAAMDGISDSFEEAVKKMSDVLAVTGRVIPITLDDITLCAKLEDDYIIKGESRIGHHNEFHKGRIKEIFIEPKDVAPVFEVIESIQEADVIIFGPGSLFTSIIPDLIVEGISETLKKSKAIKIYVCNIMTQPSETDDFNVSDHIKAIEDHTYKGIIDFCLVNNTKIPLEFNNKYHEEGSKQVDIDYNKLKKMDVSIIQGDFLKIEKNFIRHNHDKLAEVIIKLLAEKVLTKDKKRAIDYYYVNEQLKK